MLQRIKSFRISTEIDRMMHELSIKLNVSKGEVLRHAITTLYEKHFKQ